MSILILFCYTFIEHTLDLMGYPFLWTIYFYGENAVQIQKIKIAIPGRP